MQTNSPTKSASASRHPDSSATLTSCRSTRIASTTRGPDGPAARLMTELRFAPTGRATAHAVSAKAA
eukprot:15458412-Alexandrium_andersonii.AAC.2